MVTSYFTKQSEMPREKLTGMQKIAILLGELGENASEDVLNSIKLTDKQLKGIRNAMKRLGMYDPEDSVKVAREVQVLEDVYHYGEMRGILVPNPSRYVIPPVGYVKVAVNSPGNDIRQSAQNDPDAIAKVLSSWLSEDK